MNEHRKDSRRNVLFWKRKIPENMSPVVTPASKKEKREQAKASEQAAVEKRLEMLAKWKVEKEKRKELQKTTSKPIFKVTHVPVTVGLPNLETVNREIKGKPFKSKFAPANHKFRPPANIKPIYVFKNANQSELSKTKGKNQSDKELYKHKMVTRSQTRGTLEVKPALHKNDTKVEPTTEKTKAKPNKENTTNDKKKNKINIDTPPPVKPVSNKKLKPKSNEEANISEKTNRNTENIDLPSVQPVSNTKTKPKSVEEANKSEESSENKEIIDLPPPLQPVSNKKAKPKSNKEADKSEESNENKENIDLSLMSPDYPVSHIPSSESDEVQTPKKVEPPTYVSPFVTISRGKNSARKEYKVRKLGQSFSSNTSDSLDYTSPKAGAAYFTWLLDSQIARLKDLCDQWTTYKAATNPPEEAVSMIDVAIGQTNLLITKKFEQFRGLINKCQSDCKEARVTCEDLHGFWDMMHLQIDNLDKRYANLDNLKANNWQEIIPEVKKDIGKKKGRKPKTAKASTALREAIQAARKKKQTEDQITPLNQRSIRLSVVKTDEKTKRISSPGLACKTENQITSLNRSSNRLSIVKTDEQTRRISSPGLTMMKVSQFGKNVETPAKSILKDASVKSNQKSRTKSVLFHDEVIHENKKSDPNNSVTKTPIRRSHRLSKGKLF
ncbi:guanylate kinase-associated protein mars isoform X2 [Tribolium madens]|nr:guanylate kinase-associated protein mars isoform X2 [Tribolium madens]